LIVVLYVCGNGSFALTQ